MHVHVFVDEAGQTQFAPLAFESMIAVGGEMTARTVIDARPPGSVQDWHNSETSMYIITLSGQMEVEIEGGRRHQFGPGDVRLADDTTGSGHISRVLGDEPWHFIVLMLD